MKIFAKRFLAGVVDLCIARPLLSWFPDKGVEVDGLSLHTLVSECTWRMGILALSGFTALSGRRWQVVIHEDGSLRERSANLIRKLRPKWQIVMREESDKQAAAELGQFKKFLKLRSRHPLAMKFADPWLFAPGERYIFIDSDCLFFDYPDFIMRWVAKSGTQDCWFERECEGVYAYSLPITLLSQLIGCSVWQHVNTGIALLNRGAFSFERIETLLGVLEKERLSEEEDWYLEQTFFAVTATLWKKGGLLPPLYSTSYDAGVCLGRCGRVACHYVGPTKKDRFYYDGVVNLMLSCLRYGLQRGF